MVFKRKIDYNNICWKSLLNSGKDISDIAKLLSISRCSIVYALTRYFPQYLEEFRNNAKANKSLKRKLISQKSAETQRKNGHYLKISNRMKIDNPAKGKFGKANWNYKPECHIFVTRICECGCGGIFECSVNSERRFISGHNSKGRKLSEKHKQIFRLNMKINNPMKNKDIVEKVKNTIKNKSIEEKQFTIDKKRKTATKNNSYIKASKRMKENNPMKNPVTAQIACSKRLSKKEKSKLEEKYINIFNLIDKRIEFTGDGKIWIVRQNPDFRIQELKKCIEITSHKSRYYNRSFENYALPRIDKYKNHKWNCLVVFEDKNSNYNLLQLKDQIIDFINRDYSGVIEYGQFKEV